MTIVNNNEIENMDNNFIYELDKIYYTKQAEVYIENVIAIEKITLLYSNVNRTSSKFLGADCDNPHVFTTKITSAVVNKNLR